MNRQPALSDGDYREVHRLRTALDRHPQGVTASVAARAVNLPRHPEHGEPTAYARWLLTRMAERGLATATGNGNRTRWYPRG